MVNVEETFSQKPGFFSGAIVFAGTRVPAKILFEWLADGASLDEFLIDYPGVKRSQAEAALQYVAEIFEEKTLTEIVSF